MLVVPAHGRPNQEEAGKHAESIDPFVLADLLVATLMREAGAHGGHNTPSCQASQRRSDDEEQPHHDAPHDGEPHKAVHAHARAAAAARKGLAHAFLDLFIEGIWRRRGLAIGLEHLPVLVVPRMVRLEKGGAIAAAACQNCHASPRVLVHELMQVVAVAVDVPEVGVSGGRLLILGGSLAL